MKRLHILILDDEQMLLDLLTMMLPTSFLYRVFVFGRSARVDWFSTRDIRCDAV